MFLSVVVVEVHRFIRIFISSDKLLEAGHSGFFKTKRISIVGTIESSCVHQCRHDEIVYPGLEGILYFQYPFSLSERSRGDFGPDCGIFDNLFLGGHFTHQTSKDGVI